MSQITEGVIVMITDPLTVLTLEVFQHIGSSFVKRTVFLGEIISHVHNKYHGKMTG